MLAAVSPLEDKAFDEALEALTESKLVFRRGGPSDVTYVFKHALVRDAAYASLLKSRRAFSHARIAESLNELYPEQVAKEPELLAYHYAEAGLAEQALTRWLEAARRACERSAYSEAVSQLDRALELLAKTPRGIEWTRCSLDIQTLRAAALVATRGFVEPATADAYQQARALCKELGDPPEVYPVLRGLYNVVAYQGNLPAVLSVATECLQLAERGEDSAPKSLAHRLVGMCLFLMGEPTQARVHLENARDHYELRRHQHLAGTYGLDLKVVAEQFLALSLCVLGYVQQGLRVAQGALDHARQLGHPYSVASQLDGLLIAHMLRGEFPAVQEKANELETFAAEYGFAEFVDSAATKRGLALANMGCSDKNTLDELKHSVLCFHKNYGEFCAPFTLGLLARAFGDAGNIANGLGITEEALASAERCKQHWNDAELHRLKARLLTATIGEKENAANAERGYKRALTIARGQQSKSMELRVATSLARQWQNGGKTEEARALLLRSMSGSLKALIPPTLEMRRRCWMA